MKKQNLRHRAHPHNPRPPCIHFPPCGAPGCLLVVGVCIARPPTTLIAFSRINCNFKQSRTNRRTFSLSFSALTPFPLQPTIFFFLPPPLSSLHLFRTMPRSALLAEPVVLVSQCPCSLRVSTLIIVIVSSHLPCIKRREGKGRGDCRQRRRIDNNSSSPRSSIHSASSSNNCFLYKIIPLLSLAALSSKTATTRDPLFCASSYEGPA